MHVLFSDLILVRVLYLSLREDLFGVEAHYYT